MASVCFFILVAICVGHVFAEFRNCSEARIQASCDECLRCGNKWCLLENVVPRCSSVPSDEWCSHRQDKDIISGNKNIVQSNNNEIIALSESYQNGEITFVNSSITDISNIIDDRIDISFETPTAIRVFLSSDFCPAQGRMEETLTVKVKDPKWGEEKTELVTLSVPCACSCGSENRSRCNEHGTYKCGICMCDSGWKGARCQQQVIVNNGSGAIGGPGGIKGSGGIGVSGGIGGSGQQGDIPSECINGYGDICSKNGECVNGKCVCDDNREGSQYMNSTDHCMDLCLVISTYWDSCVIETSPPGQCPASENVYIDQLNRTRLDEKDDLSRKSWVMCKENNTQTSCIIEYAAMKDSKGLVHVMILDRCNQKADAAVYGSVNVALPVALGVLAVIAAAAAVAGFMLWKNRAPPLPLNDPGYGKIDAEDCTGLNPLYKPPTSSFKNPTYGKW